MAAFEAWLVFVILVVNVVGELQRKRTLAASRGFLAAARLSCYSVRNYAYSLLDPPHVRVTTLYSGKCFDSDIRYKKPSCR